MFLDCTTSALAGPGDRGYVPVIENLERLYATEQFLEE